MDITCTEDAKKVQSKKEETAIISFAGFLFFGSTVLICMFLSIEILRQNGRYLYLLLGALFTATVYFTKIYKLLQPKEITGVIVDSHIRALNSRTHPGADNPYSTRITSEIELSIKTDDGRFLLETYPYTGSNRELATGDRIAIFRFIDNPVKLNRP